VYPPGWEGLKIRIIGAQLYLHRLIVTHHFHHIKGGGEHRSGLVQAVAVDQIEGTLGVGQVISGKYLPFHKTADVRGVHVQLRYLSARSLWDCFYLKPGFAPGLSIPRHVIYIPSKTYVLRSGSDYYLRQIYDGSVGRDLMKFLHY